MGNTCKGASDCYELNDQNTADKNSTLVDKPMPNKSAFGGQNADYWARNIRVVIKAQALIRGFLARRKTKRPASSRSSSKRRYFQETDYWETLTSQKIDMHSLEDKSQLESKNYTYKTSNASYDGQWLAGFRHGQGTMSF